MRIGDKHGFYRPRLLSDEYKTIPLPVLVETWGAAIRLAESGALESFVPSLSVYGSRLEVDSGAVPDEVVSLIVAIARSHKIRSVYCPSDDYARFSAFAELEGLRAHLAVSRQTILPKLTRLLSQTAFGISMREPWDFERKVFDVSQRHESAIAFLPWRKMTTKAPIQSLNDRAFKRQTASTSVHTLVNLLNCSQKLVVVGAYNGLLVGRGAELELRKHLVEGGILEAVISMPSALLPRAELPFSILVLRPEGGVKRIRFVAGDNDNFFDKDGRNRTTLTNWELLLKAYKEGSQREIVQDVPIEEVAENNYHLEVLRYVPSAELQKAHSYTSRPGGRYKVKRLGDCVETIRPVAKIYKNGNIPAKELMTSDFPRFGYLSDPEKKVAFSKIVLSTKQRDLLFLKPHDVVVSIKGLTGAVAITPPTPPSPGKGGWLVNQSCLILRAKKMVINPVYLYMYLASEAGQALLVQISNGASTSMISIQSLKSLPVPVSSMQEMGEVTDIFYEQVALQQEVDSRISRQVELSKQYWSL